MSIAPIVTAQQLKKLPTENLIVIDAGNGSKAKENYLTKHIKGALFVDLDTQLAHVKTDAAFGGRHPLPTPQAFAEVLTKLGVTPETHIVIYDMFWGANAAARLWWMLTAIGHQNVQVLSGGLAAAEKAGIPTFKGEEKPTTKGEYKANKWLLPTANINEVEQTVTHANGLVIDVRDTPRYNGETEPIDLVAGHIPGAINVPFKENLDENRCFLSPEKLKEKYTKLFKNKDADKIIIHCGSGVTACHTLLATAYAGLSIPKLYVGSWSEWSRNNKPIANK